MGVRFCQKSENVRIKMISYPVKFLLASKKRSHIAHKVEYRPQKIEHNEQNEPLGGGASVSSN
jgi:hypothetical protein